MRRTLIALATIAPTVAAAAPLGIFTAQQDIGRPASPGSASFDGRTGTYRVTGVGRNMWADHDDFHYVWQRRAGDVVADTRLRFTSPAPAPDAMGFLHRKGGIVLRQDLDPDSAYVDVLRMGNQQMSIQYREKKGGPTRLIWFNTPRQDAVRLTRISDYAYISLLGRDGRLRPAGGSFKVRITGRYYLGLGVCPHDDTARETMAFTDVHVAPLPAKTPRPRGETLQTINIATVAEQTAVYHSDGAIRATGWSPDSHWLYFSGKDGARRAVAWDSDQIEPAATTPAALPDAAAGPTRHLSPDGKWVAYLEGATAADADVALRIAPVAAGRADADKAVTLVHFWGSATSLPRTVWSPDSKTLAFLSHD